MGTVNIDLTGLSSDADLRVIFDHNDNQIAELYQNELLAFMSANNENSNEHISIGLGYPDIPFYVQVYQHSGETDYDLTVSMV
jgi:hypothetical protein